MKTAISNNSFYKLIAAIALCEAVGVVSGFITRTEITTWFVNIQKPVWNPPAYLFGPVWGILYLLMGVSLWIIWTSNVAEDIKQKSIQLFAIQLFLNFWWSIVFFKFHSPAYAYLTILLLLMMLIVTIVNFSRTSRTAAWLLVPYIAWVTFASFLNYAIWALNY